MRCWSATSCRAAAEDGRAHRDNTTKGTAHRWFAVSINLNSESEGGEVSFPEYGPRSFKPPPGGAVVFSCSILHGVSKRCRSLTSGRLSFCSPAGQVKCDAYRAQRKRRFRSRGAEARRA